MPCSLPPPYSSILFKQAIKDGFASNHDDFGENERYINSIESDAEKGERLNTVINRRRINHLQLERILQTILLEDTALVFQPRGINCDSLISSGIVRTMQPEDFYPALTFQDEDKWIHFLYSYMYPVVPPERRQSLREKKIMDTHLKITTYCVILFYNHYI